MLGNDTCKVIAINVGIVCSISWIESIILPKVNNAAFQLIHVVLRPSQES